MEYKQYRPGRRNFLKTMGAVGAVPSVVGITNLLKAAEPERGQTDPNKTEELKTTDSLQVPKRELGKTKIKVPCLAIGTMFNLVDNQIILRSALKYGVTYWDTANNYGGGNSELGIGVFLEKNPEVRKDLFIVSKASRAKTIDQIEERLQTSLKRMKTDYIDAYYIHALSNPAQLTDELKQWVETAKKRKLIKFFGFSTHSNMAKCLGAAAKLDWIDMIMTSYNFNLVGNTEMQSAIDACYKAKIGLVAMKTIGRRSRRATGTDAEAGKKLMEQIVSKGFTQEQAAVRLVLEDKRISCACVGMESVPVLTANVAAVLDRTELTQADKQAFKKYAKATCDGYCAGCAEICDSALGGKSYVSDIMRYLMYYNGYGDNDRARELFAQIPADVRDRLLVTDYSAAEACCPQGMPISELITEAATKLA